MKNKKIAFVLPKTQWWAYYVYNKIAKLLNKKYNYKIQVINSNFWWLRTHFWKYDIVFSVIPFLFKPSKKYYFITVWNFLKERKKNRLWTKLLYLSSYNFKISDKAILMNKYLLNEIKQIQKYKNKIKIIPNFIKFDKYKSIREKNIEKIKNIETIEQLDKINILTITWFKFYDKGKWVINLKKVINKLAIKHPNKQIIRNIAGNSENEIFNKIKKEFEKISIEKNLKINWLWWIDEKELNKQLINNDLFLYWTELDVFPTTLLEAWWVWLPMLVNNFSSFKWVINNELICNSEEEMLNKLELVDLKKNQKINIENAKKYDYEKILKQFKKLIKE